MVSPQPDDSDELCRIEGVLGEKLKTDDRTEGTIQRAGTTLCSAQTTREETMASYKAALVLIAGACCGVSGGSIPTAHAQQINACINKANGGVRIPPSG